MLRGGQKGGILCPFNKMLLGGSHALFSRRPPQKKHTEAAVFFRISKPGRAVRERFGRGSCGGSEARETKFARLMFFLFLFLLLHRDSTAYSFQGVGGPLKRVVFLLVSLNTHTQQKGCPFKKDCASMSEAKTRHGGARSNFFSFGFNVQIRSRDVFGFREAAREEQGQSLVFDLFLAGHQIRSPSGAVFGVEPVTSSGFASQDDLGTAVDLAAKDKQTEAGQLRLVFFSWTFVGARRHRRFTESRLHLKPADCSDLSPQTIFHSALLVLPCPLSHRASFSESIRCPTSPDVFPVPCPPLHRPIGRLVLIFGLVLSAKIPICQAAPGRPRAAVGGGLVPGELGPRTVWSEPRPVFWGTPCSVFSWYSWESPGFSLVNTSFFSRGSTYPEKRG